MKIISAVVLILLSPTLTMAGATENACKKETIDQCLENAADGKLFTCLEKMYACGQYESIINDIHPRFSPDDAKTPEQDLVNSNEHDSEDFRSYLYFSGAAHFGMRVRKNSNVLRCSHLHKSRNNLSAYLIKKSKDFDSKGSYGGPRDIDRILHAKRILQEIEGENLCVQRSLTKQEAEGLSFKQAQNLADSFFISEPAASAIGDRIKNSKAVFSNNLKGLVERASDIETKGEIKDVELLANKDRGAFILKRFESLAPISELSFNKEGWVTGNFQSFPTKPMGRFECPAFVPGTVANFEENKCSADTQTMYKSMMSNYGVKLPSAVSLADQEQIYYCWSLIVCKQYHSYLEKLASTPSTLRRSTALRVGQKIKATGDKIVSLHQALKPNHQKHPALKNLESKIYTPEDRTIDIRMKEIDRVWAEYASDNQLCNDIQYWFCGNGEGK